MPHRRYSKANPVRYYVKVTNKLGRRGVVLFLLGLTWVLQGVSTYFNEPSPTYSLLDGNEIIRGTSWILTGAVAMVYSRRPQGFDVIGFISLYIMASYRVIAYGLAFVLWIVPGGADGNPRGIVGIFSWVTIIIMLIAVAGWEENYQEVDDDGH